jgi:hypothetical protein
MSAAATQRLQTKRQTLDEAYAPPANFLEIEVVNPVSAFPFTLHFQIPISTINQ